jgi:hypothetical protein
MVPVFRTESCQDNRTFTSKNCENYSWMTLGVARYVRSYWDRRANAGCRVWHLTIAKERGTYAALHKYCRIPTLRFLYEIHFNIFFMSASWYVSQVVSFLWTSWVKLSTQWLCLICTVADQPISRSLLWTQYNVARRIQIMQHFIKQFSPTSYYFFPPVFVCSSTTF